MFPEAVPLSPEKRSSYGHRSLKRGRRQRLKGGAEPNVDAFRNYLRCLIRHVTNFLSVYSCHPQWGGAIRDFYTTLGVRVPRTGRKWKQLEINDIVNKVRNEELNFQQCMESFDQLFHKVVVTTRVLQNKKRFDELYVVTAKFENYEGNLLMNDAFIDLDNEEPSRDKLYSMFTAADNGYEIADRRIAEGIAEAMQEFVECAGLEEAPVDEGTLSMEQLGIIDVSNIPKTYREDELRLKDDEKRVFYVEHRLGLAKSVRLHVGRMTSTHELRLVKANPLFEQDYVLTFESTNGEFTVIMRLDWLGPSQDTGSHEFTMI